MVQRMFRVGERIVWKVTDGFGGHCFNVSINEYNEEEARSIIEKNEKPEASSVIFFASEESLRYLYEEFVPREDDIFICTYAKSGTTWMQQIVFQLVFGPTEDFTEITEVSPWIETRFGYSFLSKNTKYPRIIKTHLRFEHLPSAVQQSAAKFIFIERELKSVVASYKRHLLGFGSRISEEGLIDIITQETHSLGPYSSYIESWRKKAPLVLKNLTSFVFEEIRTDLDGLIRQVAAIVNPDVSEENIARVTEYCSLQYMKDNHQKFDHTEERKFAIAARKQQNADKEFEVFSFIGEGSIAAYKDLSQESIKRLEEYKRQHNI